MQPDLSRLTRQINAMPGDVRALLEARGLMAAYEARPAYQQNDYLGWFAQAKRPETREKRINQMLRELEDGGVYMGMAWRPRQVLERRPGPD